MVKKPIYQYRRGDKVVVVYDDNSVEEIIEEERDIVSSICPDCMKVECICKK